MHIALYVNTSTVPNSTMPIAAVFDVLDAVVALKLVREDYGFWHHVIAHISEQSRILHIRGSNGHDAAFALHHANDGSFLLIAPHWSASSVLADSTEIRLIHLN